MNHLDMEEIEEAVIVGFEHALNLAMKAHERGFTMGQILRAMRQTVIKLKRRRGV